MSSIHQLITSALGSASLDVSLISITHCWTSLMYLSINCNADYNTTMGNINALMQRNFSHINQVGGL